MMNISLCILYFISGIAFGASTALEIVIAMMEND
jgi:hypothetical protein